MFDECRIASQLLTWRARWQAGVVAWPQDTAFETRFAEHLASLQPSLHLGDFETAVAAFGKRHPGLRQWFEAVLEPFNRSLFFDNGAPRLRQGWLTRWREVSSYIDADALITLALARQWRGQASPRSIVDELPQWRYFISTGDHGLDQVLREGLADIHVHFEASDPLPLLWLRLASNLVRVEDLSFFSDKTLAGLTTDKVARGRREADREILRSAFTHRESLAHHVGVRLDVDAERGDAELARERILLLSAWRRLLDGGNDATTRALARDLDAYLFAKHLFLRRHQQRAGQGPGLNRFRDFLDRGETIGERRKKTKPAVRKLRYDRMLSLATSSEHLERLELRIAPQKTMKDWLRWLKFWNDVYAKKHLDVRFVVHFIRKKGPRTHGDLHEHAGLRRLLDRQTAILQLLRVQRPDLARFIVGIDVANFERGFPPQLFAPYLQLLRGSEDLVGSWASEAVEKWRTLRARAHQRPPPALAPLGLTYHAGEDFHHPLDGLQAIGGLLEHVLRPGDRIGHGLVVGWDTERFLKIRGQAALPSGQLLDNLVWLRRETARDGGWTGACRAEGDRLIRDVAYRIYGRDLDTPALERAWAAGFNTPPDAPGRSALPEIVLAYENAYDQGVAGRRLAFCLLGEAHGLECIQHLLPQVQAKLAKRLRDRGIVIEACPTSNLVTGAVDRLGEHPFFSYLRHLDGQMVVTINTDDPGVFGTTIEVEYALMFDAMLEHVDRQTALAHLDRSRRLALNSAFGVIEVDEASAELPARRAERRPS